VVDRLRAGWSPQQIAGRLRQDAEADGEGSERLCHETIYCHVYGPEGQAEQLYLCLPRARRRRGTRHGRQPRGHRIPPERGIACRPAKVATRESFGHWEGDLLVFARAGGSANVTTLLEQALHGAQDGPARTDAPALLEVRGLRAGPKVRGVSLDVREGEIVGLAGLLGAGRTETARAVFGAGPAEGGTIRLPGGSAPGTPADAIRAGLGFVSEDRKLEGIVPAMSVRENLTLALLPQLARRCAAFVSGVVGGVDGPSGSATPLRQLP